MSGLAFALGMLFGVWMERGYGTWTLHIIENGKFTWRWKRKP